MNRVGTIILTALLLFVVRLHAAEITRGGGSPQRTLAAPKTLEFRRINNKYNEYYANSIPPQNAARSIKGFRPLALFRVGAADLFPDRMRPRGSGSSVAGLL